MVCSACRKSVPETGKFCPLCGAPLRVPTKPSIQCSRCGAQCETTVPFCAQCGNSLSARHGRRRMPLVLGAAAFAAILLLVFAHSDDTNNSRPSVSQAHPADSKGSVPAGATGGANAESANGPPPLAPVALHANEFIKNPFANRGKRIRLDVTEYPVLFENNLIRYMEYTGPPGIGEQLTPRGVRFKRMLSQEEQIYDVTAVNQGGMLSQGTSFTDVISLGELVVKVPPGQGELDSKRSWVVEPLGTIDGTNGFGASISVAVVRFWAYYDPQTQNWPVDEDAAVKDPTTGLVYYPIVYAAYSFLNFPPKFKGRLIQLDTNCISFIENGSFHGAYCAPPDKMPSLTLEKLISNEAAIYAVNATKSEERTDGTYVPIGKLLITTGDGSPGDLKIGRTWLVEVLGPMRVPADSGEATIMPGYRFVRYF